MTAELLRDQLAIETEWFMENAPLAQRVAEPRILVHRLLAIGSERGLPFRSTVLQAAQWLADNPKRAPKRRVGQFYATWFGRQRPPSPVRYKALAPIRALGRLTDWVKGS